jgi:hypothetical protein
MATAPTAAVSVLGLPPLHLKVEAEAEAEAGTYRLICSEQWRPRSIWYVTHMVKETHLTERDLTK